MRITDAHMHVGLGGYETIRILKSMDQLGVELSWLLTWEEINPPIEKLNLRLPPEPVLEAAAKYPERFVPFYAPDPATGSVDQQFSKYKELGIRGCGELKVSRKWDDPLIGSYLNLVQDYNYCLIFHMENPRKQYISEKEGKIEWVLERLLNDKFNGISRHYLTRFAERTGILRKKIRKNQEPFPGILFDFTSLEKRIRQFPGIRFVGHGPDFWNSISLHNNPAYIHQKGPIKEFGIIDRLLEEYDNLYCDISGTSGFNAMNRDHSQSKKFIQKQAGKIMYGTDNTRFPLLELLKSFSPGKETLDQILHKNSVNVLEG